MHYSIGVFKSIGVVKLQFYNLMKFKHIYLLIIKDRIVYGKSAFRWALILFEQGPCLNGYK